MSAIQKANRLLRRRHRYTTAERRAIFDADRIPLTNVAVCRYCGGLVQFDSDWEVAHETPWSRFGSNALSNVGVAHKRCNRAAGDEPMPVLKRLSLRTWLYFIAIALGAIIIIFALQQADAGSTPGARAANAIAWEKPDRTVRHYIVQAQRQARRQHCITAQADFANAYLAFYRHRRADAYTWLRRGDTHLLQCRRAGRHD